MQSNAEQQPQGEAAELPLTSWLIKQVLPEHFLSGVPPGAREGLLVLGVVVVSCVLAVAWIRPSAAQARQRRKFH